MTYRIYRVPAERAEYAAIVATLHHELFPSLIFPYPHYGDWYVAWKVDKPIAFACTAPTHLYPNCGYLQRVGVLPGHRGHRLQFRLMAHCEYDAKHVHGWEAVVSDTTRNPHSAANFVRRKWLQYEPAPEHKAVWGSKHTKYWRKDL